jgi:hypothetical protein
MAASPYEQLKDDLGYLALGRAAECFATVAERAKAEEWSHVEYLAHVIGEQATATTNRRLAARLRFARFPFRRTIEDFEFSFQPSVDRKLVADLASLRFIGENRPILFLGQPGCGKTHCETPIHRSSQDRHHAGAGNDGHDSKDSLAFRDAEVPLLWICLPRCRRRPGAPHCWPDQKPVHPPRAV